MPGMYNIQDSANRQNMAAQLGAMVPAVGKLTAIGSWLASVLAFPWEAVMRHNFGERYFTFTNALFAIFFVAVPVGSMMSGGGRFIALYLLIAQGIAAYHLYRIWQRKRRGEMWYSYHDGTPWLVHLVRRAYPMSEANVQRFVEPAIGLALVLVLFLWQGLNGGVVYLFISIVAAVLGTNLRLQEERHQWLDMIDGQLRSRYMAEAASGAPASQTQGITIAQDNVTLIRELSKDQKMRQAVPLKLRAVVSELSPEEQAMLDAEEAAERGEPTVTPPPASPADNRHTAPAVDPFSMLDEDELSGDGKAARPEKAAGARQYGGGTDTQTEGS